MPPSQNDGAGAAPDSNDTNSGSSSPAVCLSPTAPLLGASSGQDQHDDQPLSECVCSGATYDQGPSSTCPVFVNGFAVRGPGFSSASEFFDGLLNKRDLSSEVMQEKECFDHTFFQTSVLQATYTDPQIRFLLELTYEALVEAGVNDFSSLPASNVGVYVGSSFSDFHQATLANKHVEGYEHIGAAGTMLANSISRFFRFGGVSMKIDSACSSSLQALDMVSPSLSFVLRSRTTPPTTSKCILRNHPPAVL